MQSRRYVSRVMYPGMSHYHIVILSAVGDQKIFKHVLLLRKKEYDISYCLFDFSAEPYKWRD